MKKNHEDSGTGSFLNTEHIVTVEKMAVGGAGVARIPFNEKLIVVFIDRVAPNEKVKIKIIAAEKNYLKAVLIEIITPSPFRREAPCEYFKNCGGCSWQHIEETEQVRQKETILKELLHKFIPDIAYSLEPTITSKFSFNYRNRIQLKHKNGRLGYFQRETHEIVDIDYCLIADKKISEQIPLLRQKLKPSSELKKYELRLNQENIFESYKIGETGEGLAFSQVNNFVNAELVSSVVEIVKKISPSFLTELYAGSGNFSFELLKEAKTLKIESAELNEELTTFAIKKMFALGFQKRIFAFTANCDHFVQRRPLSKEFILLDPPRAGCSEIVLNKVAEVQPQSLIYISCHPVYLARDLKRLMSNSTRYKIDKIQIFDMFPQTDHFETLVHLSLNES